ncbi:MAG: class I SAM-dependent methyltransferase [Butyricicoccus sp.]
MQKNSMTAVVSAFARAYHSKYSGVKIFDDVHAEALLGNDYHAVAQNMGSGISFFHPAFRGSSEQALRWIVDNYLSPSPLGRAAFAERALENAVAIGAGQYLIFAAGYDSFAFRRPAWAEKLPVFELDHPETAADKQQRLTQAGLTVPDHTYFLHADFTQPDWPRCLREHPQFSSEQIAFCSLLGISYYLSSDAFRALLTGIAALVPRGSSIVLDYPDEYTYTEQAGERARKQAMLAGGANEAMLASYSYRDMEQLLSDCGFCIYEHLVPEQITQQYFRAYNEANPDHPISAFDNVNYCLAVKQ